MQIKHLILLTSNFPYGTGETFLENEIEFLCQGFEKVTIVSFSEIGEEMRKVPKNCEVKRFDKPLNSFDKIKAIKGVLDAHFWKERNIIRRIYHQKLTKGILSTLLISLYQGKKIAQWLKETFTTQLNSTVFYSYWCDDMAIGLALMKERNKIKTIARNHGWDVYFDVHEINYLPFRHLISEQFDLICPISERGKLAIKNVWKATIANVSVQRLGVKNWQKIDYKEEKNPFTIVSCANLIPLKRIRLLAKALQNITEFPIRWTHFGDGVLMEELKRQVEQLPSNIQVDLRGRIPNAEIYQAYSELKPHLFINVSSSEGVPVSIMEAMSFGIPVVATDVGGNGEIVDDKNGKLLPPNPTTTEIENAIRYFYSMDEDIFTEYSENSYSTWKEKYNAERNYRAFVGMIK